MSSSSTSYENRIGRFSQHIQDVCQSEATSNNPQFAHIDEEALYVSLRERVDYLTAFLNFTEEDVEALNDISLLLEPLVDSIVDRVYTHLFTFDVTKKVFMPKAGNVDDGTLLNSLHDLTLDSPQVLKRKKTFAVYVRKLVGADYNEFATWEYFDKVGLMHTGEAALKHRKLAGKDGLYVDIMHLSALLAWTNDALTPVILGNSEMTMDRKIETIRALNKVMWIQNDLFSRHYTIRSHDVKNVIRGDGGSGFGSATASGDSGNTSGPQGKALSRDWKEGEGSPAFPEQSRLPVASVNEEGRKKSLWKTLFNN